MTAIIDKGKTIKDNQTHVTDTGSPEVQIAVLSEQIQHLTEHFKTHRKDHSSRRGMIAKINNRRKLLDYLKRKASDRYVAIVAKLGLRR